MKFKVATWNVNSLRIRLTDLIEWLSIHQPDIMAIQETKLQDHAFPIKELNEAGYHVIFSGQKTYNGVAMLTKSGNDFSEVITDLPELNDPQRRILCVNWHGIKFLNLYVPNGQSLDSEKYTYKLNWLEKVYNYLQEQILVHNKIIVLGDFNIAPHSADVANPELWEGGVIVSESERKAFKKITDLGLQDTFRLFDQPAETYSWWDYRAASFQRNHGLRIDLILASKELAKKCLSCNIDIEARKAVRPSDHAPVMAFFDLPISESLP